MFQAISPVVGAFPVEGTGQGKMDREIGIGMFFEEIIDCPVAADRIILSAEQNDNAAAAVFDDFRHGVQCGLSCTEIPPVGVNPAGAGQEKHIPEAPAGFFERFHIEIPVDMDIEKSLIAIGETADHPGHLLRKLVCENDVIPNHLMDSFQ